jgi:DNA-binding transcriptional MerR regulator
VEAVSQALGVSVSTLERWRADALASPDRERVWTAVARLQAVISTAAMDESQRSAWCRQNGVYPTQLQQWKEDATAALGAESEARVSPQQTRDARKRIKELERDLRRKDKALAETTALLVLSKKFEAILQRDEEE